jgi:hypothetical protein
VKRGDILRIFTSAKTVCVDPDLHHFSNLDPHPHQYKSGSGTASNKNQDPDQHQSDTLDPELDPDPH